MSKSDVKKYSEFVKSMEQDYSSIDKFLLNPKNKSLLYGYIGLTTEAGEIGDILKKYIFRPEGHHPTDTEFLEECGDSLFFLTLLLATKGCTLEDAIESNIAKLKTRYPNGFDLDRYLRSKRDKGKEALAMTNILKQRQYEEEEENEYEEI